MEVHQDRFTALRRSFFGAALVLFVLSLADCGQNPLSTEPASGTFGSVYQTIRTANCVVCHVVGNSASYGDLDFTSQTTAFTTLTTKKVTGPASVGQCGTFNLVVAGSPATSYFAAVLFTDYASGYGSCVPYSLHHTDQNITADEQASFVAWIQNGALNN
jgi:hypothetical protein